MDFYWHYSGRESIDQSGKNNFFRAIEVGKQVFRTLTEYIQVIEAHISHWKSNIVALSAGVNDWACGKHKHIISILSKLTILVKLAHHYTRQIVCRHILTMSLDSALFKLHYIKFYHIFVISLLIVCSLTFSYREASPIKSRVCDVLWLMLLLIYSQGPCIGNQLALAHSRLWDAVSGFLFIFAQMQNKLSKVC